MSFFVDGYANFGQAPAARYYGLSSNPATEVKARRSGRGKTACDSDWLCGSHISGFPHRIIRLEPPIDVRRLRLQRTDVKRQHKTLKLVSLGGQVKGCAGQILSPESGVSATANTPTKTITTALRNYVTTETFTPMSPMGTDDTDELREKI